MNEHNDIEMKEDLGSEGSVMHSQPGTGVGYFRRAVSAMKRC